MTSSTDRIEREIVLDFPRSRVWRAITDVQQFNQWFGVALEQPFAPGAAVSGHMAMKGYEHLLLTVWVETIAPEHEFSFRWHPNAIDQSIDYSAEPTTLVTFLLDEVDGGTKLRIMETGFDALPESRRAKAFAGNSGGWTAQTERIRKYLVGAPAAAGV